VTFEFEFTTELFWLSIALWNDIHNIRVGVRV